MEICESLVNFHAIVAKYFVFAFNNLSKNSNILLENGGNYSLMYINA